MKRTLHLLLCIFLVIGCIHRSGAQIISTIAGTPGSVGYTGDGAQATLATFNTPTSIALDNAGNIYVSDQGNNVVRKITYPSGYISTIAGDGTHGFGGDGMAATAAKLWQNWGITVDGPGNVYITDQDNHRVRKVNVSGIITTVVGTGINRYLGNGGPAVAADIERPIGITLDGAGNMYVGDEDTFVIRKVNASGIISTIAGYGGSGYTGDGGPATNATFNDTYSLAVDAAGNLYICDGGNNCIRKVSTSGIITTVAGNGTPGSGGDGGPAISAQLNHPTGVCVDATGNMYIADYSNNRIRKVNASGIISTIAGTGTPGFSGDGGLAVAARLNNPICIAIDTIGDIYFSDIGNSVIRKISKDLIFIHGRKVYISICQDAAFSLDSALAIQDLDLGLTDTWTLVSSPLQGIVAPPSYTGTSTGGTILSGMSYTPNSGYVGTDSFTVRVSNGIDSGIITVYVTVNSKLSYAGAISGPSVVCVNASIILTDSVGSGIWGTTSLDATVSSDGVVTGHFPGPDTISYKIANLCGSVTASKIISVHAQPDAGSISGPSAICVGSGATYTDTTASGIWGSSNSKLAIAASGLAAGISPGIDTVFYTVSDAFCSAKALLGVTVDSFPVPRIIPADTTICVGVTINLDSLPGGGTWTINNANATFSQGSLTAVSAGLDTANYFFTNACGTGAAHAYINIDPLPVTPTITQSGSTISVAPGYTVYQWMLNGTPILGSIVDTYLVASTGLYSVYVSNIYGCSTISAGVEVTGCTPDDIAVYPNPTESIVYIKWCKKLIVKILCEDGKTFDIIKGVNQADLSYLPNGNYLIVLYDMNGIKLKTKQVTKWTK